MKKNPEIQWDPCQICRANAVFWSQAPQLLRVCCGSTELRRFGELVEDFLWKMSNFIRIQRVSTCFNVLQRVSTCFNVFQRVSTCFNVFQRVSTCFNVFQRASTCFNVLQRVSTCFNVFQPIKDQWFEMLWVSSNQILSMINGLALDQFYLWLVQLRLMCIQIIQNFIVYPWVNLTGLHITELDGLTLINVVGPEAWSSVLCNDMIEKLCSPGFHQPKFSFRQKLTKHGNSSLRCVGVCFALRSASWPESSDSAVLGAATWQTAPCIDLHRSFRSFCFVPTTFPASHFLHRTWAFRCPCPSHCMTFSHVFRFSHVFTVCISLSPSFTKRQRVSHLQRHVFSKAQLSPSIMKPSARPSPLLPIQCASATCLLFKGNRVTHQILSDHISLVTVSLLQSLLRINGDCSTQIDRDSDKPRGWRCAPVSTTPKRKTKRFHETWKHARRNMQDIPEPRSVRAAPICRCRPKVKNNLQQRCKLKNDASNATEASPK